ncbi:hypothetical protein [Paenibacillus sp. HJGM_3]|uniref:hypothetical protein n=1 Tax=Paenibacillus sp. HJGM_3 TaxID=3379816 RepID=UPI00385D8314
MSQQYVEVELGGSTRQLRFDFNAICDIEEKFGKGVAAIFSEEQIGFNLVRLFYWAGLKWRDRGLTVERVGQMLYKEIEAGQNLNDLLQPIMKALKQSRVLGEMKEASGDEGNGQSGTVE